MSATRQTYQIPAREVVPGMLYVLQNRLGKTREITDVERAGAEVFLGERHFFDRSDIDVAVRGWHEPGINDAILHCFYLELPPQPEHREPTPWASHAGYEELAVRYG